MKWIAASMRVMEERSYGESRDALDPRWPAFLDACGFGVIPVLNHSGTAHHIFTLPLSGILLTGGSQYPRRDETEALLLAEAKKRKLPVMGVCHGMQVMQREFGLDVAEITGHVLHEQEILIHGQKAVVNSYHELGSKKTAPGLDVWATAADSTIKAVRCDARRWLGIMWHPERMQPYAQRDLDLFRQWFTQEQ